MESEKRKVPSYLQVGYFVDYSSLEKYSEYEIIQIENNKIVIRSLKDEASKHALDINSMKIKPFRIYTKANQNSIFYHRKYNYWSDGIIEVIETLNKMINSNDILTDFTDIELVQFLKGKNYFVIMSMAQSKNITEANLAVLASYVENFLQFFEGYWRSFDANHCFDTKQIIREMGLGKIYKSPNNAFMFSYSEVLIGLSIMFGRHSILSVDREQNQSQDKLMAMQLQWLQSRLIPQILEKNMKTLNLDSSFKMLVLIIKLVSAKTIQRTDQVMKCLKHLFECVEYFLSKTSSFMKFSENQLLLKQVEVIVEKGSFQYYCWLTAKIKLYLKLLDLTPDIFNQAERQSRLIKHMSFIKDCIDHKQVHDYVDQYLTHENGLPFYLKNSIISHHSHEFLKLFSYCPEFIIKEAVRIKKIDILKTINQWPAEHIKVLVQSYFQNNSSKTKQSITFSIELYKIVSSQLKALSEEKNRKKIQKSQNKVLQQEIKQQSMQTIVDDKCDQGLLTLEKDIILVTQSIEKLEFRIIQLFQEFCDASEKTPIIQYVQKNILPKYIRRLNPNISYTLEAKETNSFKQNYIIKCYINRLSNNTNKDIKELRNQLVNVYSKLCSSMVGIKSKNLIQFRRENLIAILNKIATFSPQILPDLICDYIEKVKQIQGKQSKAKSFQFIISLCSKNGVFENQLKKIESFKKIISCIKIEHSTQFKFYFQLFKIINQTQGNLKIHQDSYVPLVIYKPLFGLQKFYEVLQNCSGQKFMIKKICQFFSKIHLKIVDEALKRSMIPQLCNELINSLKICLKQEISRIEQQFLTQIINLLLSLLVTSRDPPNHVLDYSYCELFPVEPPEINFHKNSIKIIVKFQDSQAQSDQCNESQENKQCVFTKQTTEKLYSIKERAAAFFQVSPLQSHLYYFNNQKISIQNENESLKFFLDRQEGSEQPSVVEVNRDGEVQQHSYIKESDEKVMHFILKPHDVQFTAKQYIMTRLDIVFLCLPFTEKLWQTLQIPISTWSEKPELKQIKNDFLVSYEPQMESQQNQKIKYWNYIIWDRTRKNIILEALLNDQWLDEYDMDWLFESFSSIEEKRDIENNLLCLSLIQRMQLKITQQSATFMLQMLKIDEKTIDQNWVSQLSAHQKQYQQLKRKTLQYIQQKSIFSHFSYMMRLKQSFYLSLSNCPKLVYDIDAFFLKVFQSYIKTAKCEEFTKRMTKYLQQNTMQFQYLIRIILQNQTNISQQAQYFQTYQSWLKSAIIYLISNQNLWEEYQINHHILRASMSLIACLLSKNIKSDLIFYEDFKQILNRTIFSDLCEQSISIITCMINYSEKQGQHYVKFFEKEMYEPEWEKKEKISFNKCNIRSDTGLMGLKNPHSICYVNSLLQQLYYIKAFREFMYQTDWKINDSPQEDLILQLKKIFLNLNFRQSDSYLNSSFFQAFKNDQGTATSMQIQMDVDQFRSILFDRIQNLVIKPENQNRNFVQKVFNGKQITIIKSKQCQHESSREEQFSSICLEVKGLKNLQNALQNYFKPEILNQDNKYFCEECNKKVVAQKINRIKQYPNHLIFVLKRFEYIYQLRKKINDAFQFPLNIFRMNENTYYRLKGVIVHQGLSQIGHYFSLININGKWFEFNDNIVSEVFEEDVIKDSYGQQTQRCTRNAYLLIYEKIQANEIQSIKFRNQMPQSSKWPKQKGLDQQIKNVMKFNLLLWKSDLFLSHSFQLFVGNAAKLKIKNSSNLLLQYITTIKAKLPKTNVIFHFKQLFSTLQACASNSILSCDLHIEWIIQFYRNSQVNPSIKTALSSILIRKHFKLDEYMIKFLKLCLISLHDQIQTGPIYKLLFYLAKKYQQVTKFLVDARIIGRIFDTTIPKLLLSCDREQLAQSTDIHFPLIDSSKIQKKKAIESKELKYHKWKLLTYIVDQSNLSLSKTEQSYVYSWNDRKYLGLLEDATTKASINQISIFFMVVSSRNTAFGNLYLKELCRQISKPQSENARKYLRGAMQLITINDQSKADRLKLLKAAFVDGFKVMYEQKIMSSFDIKWQWFMKMAYKYSQFRRVVRAAADQLRTINSKSQLQLLYLTRSGINSEGKQKNKYYGLKFTHSSTSNNNFLDEKYQKSRKIFTEDDEYFKKFNNEQPDYDKDLSDYHSLQLRAGSAVLLYNQDQCRFKQTTILQVLGDLIQIEEKLFYDRGNQRLMPVNKKQSTIKQPRNILPPSS